MREVVVLCDECKGVIDGPVYMLHEMNMSIGKDKGEWKPVKMVSSEYMIHEGKPDFCGVPCLLRWINNKLTGVKNGNNT